MQSQKDVGRGLDFSNSINLKMFLGCTVHHTLHHAMGIPHSRRENIDPGGFDKMPCLRSGCQNLVRSLYVLMNFRTGSDIADLAFDQNRRVDGLERFDGFLCLSDVLFKWQGG